jgi:hypothetical protein
LSRFQALGKVILVHLGLGALVKAYSSTAMADREIDLVPEKTGYILGAASSTAMRPSSKTSS